MVWEKMYDPVKPPHTPLKKLDHPTVTNSWSIFNGLPMSISMAETSKHELNDTRKVIPIQVGSNGKNAELLISWRL